jgi:hypothetical protein
MSPENFACIGGYPRSLVIVTKRGRVSTWLLPMEFEQYLNWCPNEKRTKEHYLPRTDVSGVGEIGAGAKRLL